MFYLKGWINIFSLILLPTVMAVSVTLYSDYVSNIVGDFIIVLTLSSPCLGLITSMVGIKIGDMVFEFLILSLESYVASLFSFSSLLRTFTGFSIN